MTVAELSILIPIAAGQVILIIEAIRKRDQAGLTREIHTEVQTMNGVTVGEATDQAEARRVKTDV